MIRDHSINIKWIILLFFLYLPTCRKDNASDVKSGETEIKEQKNSKSLQLKPPQQRLLNAMAVISPRFSEQLISEQWLASKNRNNIKSKHEPEQLASPLEVVFEHAIRPLIHPIDQMFKEKIKAGTVDEDCKQLAGTNPSRFTLGCFVNYYEACLEVYSEVDTGEDWCNTIYGNAIYEDKAKLENETDYVGELVMVSEYAPQWSTNLLAKNPTLAYISLDQFYGQTYRFASHSDIYEYFEKPEEEQYASSLLFETRLLEAIELYVNERISLEASADGQNDGMQRVLAQQNIPSLGFTQENEKNIDEEFLKSSTYDRSTPLGHYLTTLLRIYLLTLDSKSFLPRNGENMLAISLSDIPFQACGKPVDSNKSYSQQIYAKFYLPLKQLIGAIADQPTEQFNHPCFAFFSPKVAADANQLSMVEKICALSIFSPTLVTREEKTEWTLDLTIDQFQSKGEPILVEEVNLLKDMALLTEYLYPNLDRQTYTIKHQLEDADGVPYFGYSSTCPHLKKLDQVLQNVQDPLTSLPDLYALTVVDTPSEQENPALAMKWQFNLPQKKANNSLLYIIDSLHPAVSDGTPLTYYAIMPLDFLIAHNCMTAHDIISIINQNKVNQMIWSRIIPIPTHPCAGKYNIQLLNDTQKQIHLTLEGILGIGIVLTRFNIGGYAIAKLSLDGEPSIIEDLKTQADIGIQLIPPYSVIQAIIQRPNFLIGKIEDLGAFRFDYTQQNNGYPNPHRRTFGSPFPVAMDQLTLQYYHQDHYKHDLYAYEIKGLSSISPQFNRTTDAGVQLSGPVFHQATGSIIGLKFNLSTFRSDISWQHFFSNSTDASKNGGYLDFHLLLQGFTELCYDPALQFDVQAMGSRGVLCNHIFAYYLGRHFPLPIQAFTEDTAINRKKYIAAAQDKPVICENPEAPCIDLPVQLKHYAKSPLLQYRIVAKSPNSFIGRQEDDEIMIAMRNEFFESLYGDSIDRTEHTLETMFKPSDYVVQEGKGRLKTINPVFDPAATFTEADEPQDRRLEIISRRNDEQNNMIALLSNKSGEQTIRESAIFATKQQSESTTIAGNQPFTYSPISETSSTPQPEAANNQTPPTRYAPRDSDQQTGCSIHATVQPTPFPFYLYCLIFWPGIYFLICRSRNP